MWSGQIQWEQVDSAVLSIQCRIWRNLAFILDLCISVHFSTPATPETLFPFALRWFISTNLELLPPFLSFWEKRSSPSTASKLWGAPANLCPLPKRTSSSHGNQQSSRGLASVAGSADGYSCAQIWAHFSPRKLKFQWTQWDEPPMENNMLSVGIAAQVLPLTMENVELNFTKWIFAMVKIVNESKLPLKVTGQQQRGTTKQGFTRNASQQCEEMGFGERRPHKSEGGTLSPLPALPQPPPLWGAGQILTGAWGRGEACSCPPVYIQEGKQVTTLHGAGPWGGEDGGELPTPGSRQGGILWLLWGGCFCTLLGQLRGPKCPLPGQPHACHHRGHKRCYQQKSLL